MGCIFFEGFNHKNSDHTNLDISYWSGDYGYNFIDGRTDTCHIIPSRSSEDSDLNNNKTLWLSGFPAITGDNTYYGFGAFIGQITTNTSGNGSSFPYRENIVSFYDDSTEIFRLNTTWMTQSGIAIELEQNGSYTEIPLYYSPLPANASEYADTELLVHFDGGTNTEHLTDYSSNGLTVSLNDDAGNGNFITTDSKFGDNAHNFDSAASNGIDIIMDKTIFDNDFTIEYWFKFGTGVVFCSFLNLVGYTTSSSQYDDLLYSFGAEQFSTSKYGYTWLANSDSGQSVSTDFNYHHIAIVRNGNTITQYLDGVPIIIDANNNTDLDVSSDSSFISNGSDNDYILVAIGYDTYDGYVKTNGQSTSSTLIIDELRISSVALYTSNFSSSLPSEPFPNNIISNNSNHSIDNRTYTISSNNDRTHLRLLTPRNRIDLTSVVDDICNNENQEIVTASAMYLEVFGQSNDGTDPATTGTLHVKVDGVEITPATGISVSGFNNLNKVAFHGTHHASGECSGYYDGISLQPEYRIVDDMYLASGTGINETNLGASTRIFRLTPNSNTRNEWKRNFNTTANINDVLSSNDNQQWVGTNVEGALCINHYDNLNTTNTIIDGIKVNNLDQSDYDQRSYCNVIVSGSNASSGPFLTLGSLKSTDTRYFKDNNEFVFQNPVTQSTWTKSNINQMQVGIVAGNVTSDCEAGGGFVIQGAGSDFANGIYCNDPSQGQAVNKIGIQSTSSVYYNTKNNGYYISYENTGTDQGWFIYDNLDNKMYKNDASAGSTAPDSSWSLSDYGVGSPPAITLSLNLPFFSYPSVQSINYTP